jgi:hypothetical protein
MDKSESKDRDKGDAPTTKKKPPPVQKKGPYKWKERKELDEK